MQMKSLHQFKTKLLQQRSMCTADVLKNFKPTTDLIYLCNLIEIFKHDRIGYNPYKPEGGVKDALVNPYILTQHFCGCNSHFIQRRLFSVYHTSFARYAWVPFVNIDSF